MRNKRVITTDGVFRVLSAGGQIQYRPVKHNQRWAWALWARYPGEEFVHVRSSKTGDLRFFKSADALFGYHLRLFPESEGVFVPATINTTHEFSKTDPDSRDGEDFEDTQ